MNHKIKHITDFSKYFNQMEYSKHPDVIVEYFSNGKIFSIDNEKEDTHCVYSIEGELLLIRCDCGKLSYMFDNRTLSTIKYFSDDLLIKSYLTDGIITHKEITCHYKNKVYNKDIQYYDNGNILCVYYKHFFNASIFRECHNNSPARIVYDINGNVVKRVYRLLLDDNSTVAVNMKDAKLTFEKLNHSVSRCKIKKSLMTLKLKCLDSYLKGLITKDEYNILKNKIECKLIIYIL